MWDCRFCASLTVKQVKLNDTSVNIYFLSAPTEQQQLSGADEGPHRRGPAQTPPARQPREAQNPQAERGFPQSPGPAAGIPLLKPPPLMLRLLSPLKGSSPLRLLPDEKHCLGPTSRQYEITHKPEGERSTETLICTSSWCVFWHLSYWI